MSMTLPLQPALAAWLRARLTGPSGRADWRRLVGAAWARFLDTPLATLLPRAAVDALVAADLTPDRTVALVRPITRAGLRYLASRMRQDHAPVQRWVPAEAVRVVDRIAARPRLVHPDWIRSFFREEAVEAVISDTLYKALRDFSTIIPRMILNALPVGRLFPGAGSIGTRVVEEIERRIEPEIKSFLQSGTKKALERAADFTIQHLDDPASVRTRRNLVAFVLSQSPSFHAQSLSDEVLADVDEAAERIARHVATLDATRDEVRALLDAIAAPHAERPLRDALTAAGADLSPDLDAIAECTWPIVMAFLATPEVDAWLESIVGELLVAQRDLQP